MTGTGSVPSPQFGTAEAALDWLLDGARRLQGAIAFATCGGVEILAGILARHEVQEVSLVVRGAPITEPEALLELRELGVEVAVIVGQDAARFHPKLWLAERSADSLAILSGSGNLTAGGLRGNREQFELDEITGDGVAEQRQRYELLTAGAIPLDNFVDSIAWRAWLRQLRRREELARKLREMDEEIATSHSQSREAHKRALMDGLWDIYHRTRDAKLRKPDGSIYTPSGLRLELEGKRGPTEPVKIACNLCKGETDGFEEMIRLGHRDLTVESLLIDPDKPYHTLIPEEIRRVSAERLEAALRR
jgi:hypothetical protein